MTATNKNNKYFYELPKEVMSFLTKTCNQINKEIKDYEKKAGKISNTSDRSTKSSGTRSDNGKKQYMDVRANASMTDVDMMVKSL